MSNQAAFVDSQGAPIAVREAPYPTCKPGYVIVKNAAIALNPIDWKLQAFGFLIRSWPTVLGSDVAGEIVEVGEGVQDLKSGQRVVGHAFALATGDSAEAAFQHFTLVPARMVALIPDAMTYQNASVIPLSLSCAAAALFENSSLGLPLPGSETGNDQAVIVIWGGSSSVASSAIQLARACGLDVVATASPKNFDYVKGLGASKVFDYADPQIVPKLVDAAKAKKCVGAFDTVGANISQCVEVLSQLGGGHVAATGDPPQDLPAGVTANHVFATSIKDNEIGKAIYNDYLPKALLDESFEPTPAPTVVGKGLDALQGGLDRLKGGVSATKLVVTL